MKKLLILIISLLTFSMLVTSVSAPVPEYFAARFYGKVNGCCWVFEEQPPPDPVLYPDASGKGRLHTSGSALVRWDPSQNLYWAAKPSDPNTALWTRRTYVNVRWNSERLMVHMWASHHTHSMFNDTTHTIHLIFMSFSGYHIGPAGRHFIRGVAMIQVGILPTTTGEVQAAAVMLYLGAFDPADHFRTFVWQGEETELLPSGCMARRITHRFTLRPTPWYLSPP